MNIFWDTTKRKLVEAFDDDTEVSELTIAARDLESLVVSVLYRTGTATAPFAIQSLPSGAQVVFGAKYDLDGSYCAYADAFVQSGSGNDIVHTGDANFNTAGTLAAIASAATDELTITGELALILSSGKKAWSTQISIKIVNDVIRGETPPVATGGGQATRFLLDANGAKGLGWYNADGILLATAWPAGVTPVEPYAEGS